MAAKKPTPPLAAHVLHSYDWSESSLIVELFTRTQGRLVVAAKGAKRPTSNFRPVLLPFHALAVWLSRGSAEEADEIRSLRSVEWAGGQPLDAARLMAGFYMNELLLKGLARQDPHPALYDAYTEALAALAALHARGDAAATPALDAEAAVLRAFELVWLRELGWLPELDAVTALATPIQPGARYGLRAESGLVPDTEGALGRTWVSLQAALVHGSFAALCQACRGRPLDEMHGEGPGDEPGDGRGDGRGDGASGGTSGGDSGGARAGARDGASASASAPRPRSDAAALRTSLRQLVQYHLATPLLRTRRVGQQMQRLASGAAGRAAAR